MECLEIRINQLKQSNRELRELLKDYEDYPKIQNKLFDEIKLNEQIIKFLETL